jgi:hypothetical protein
MSGFSGYLDQVYTALDGGKKNIYGRQLSDVK